jgi:phosphoenolpyruvate carboxykinase (GTP)
MPPLEAIDLVGLDGYSRGRLAEALAIDPAEWQQEIELQGELFAKLGERLPKELQYERELLRSRLA